ncbi:MAG: GTPase Era [Candidatus Aminicenantes bacterium]|nr:GTPase Era [Candidatus Aminicenantes bacterium]
MSQFKSGFVSIVGRTNVGKSTLLNSYVGEKVAIISDKPQTTRWRIQGVRTYPEGQIVFIDTPGIHKPKYKLSQRMVELSLQSLKDVDLILFMVDASQPFGKGDQFVIDQLQKLRIPVFLLLNKIDLIKKENLLPLIDTYQSLYSFAEIIPVSALKGDNLDRLRDRILEYLPPGDPYFPPDQFTDQSERLIVAELIREKILSHTREELPYSTTVMVDSFKTDEEKKLIRISAIIYVDKKSQKGIIIGKDGSLLKRIGTQARQDIERILNSRVFLQLWVKVKKGWRQDERFLERLGMQ